MVIEKVVLPCILALLMFGLGLSLRLADFGRIGRNWKVVVLALFSILVLMPLSAWAIGLALALPPAYAAGLILLATCPGGMFSNMVTHGCKADLPLSLALTVCSSVLYVLVAPWFLVNGSWAQPVATITLELIGVVLLPLSAGMWVNQRWPVWATRYAGMARTVSVVLIALLFVALALDQLDSILANGGFVVLAVALLNGVGWCLTALLVFLLRLSSHEFIAVGAEHSIRQEGIGVFVAVTLLAQPEMAVPVLTNSFVGFAVCLAVVALIVKKEAKS
jgi:bile acid:Na+ symporter, BASS family